MHREMNVDVELMQSMIPQRKEKYTDEEAKEEVERKKENKKTFFGKLPKPTKDTKIIGYTPVLSDYVSYESFREGVRAWTHLHGACPQMHLVVHLTEKFRQSPKDTIASNVLQRKWKK